MEAILTGQNVQNFAKEANFTYYK